MGTSSTWCPRTSRAWRAPAGSTSVGGARTCPRVGYFHVIILSPGYFSSALGCSQVALSGLPLYRVPSLTPAERLHSRVEESAGAEFVQGVVVPAVVWHAGIRIPQFPEFGRVELPCSFPHLFVRTWRDVCENYARSVGDNGSAAGLVE